MDVLERLLTDAAFIAEMARLQDASEALQMIGTALDAQGSRSKTVEMTSGHVHRLFVGCLERNSVDLCLSIYREMMSLPRLSDSQEDSLQWPPVSFEVTCALILALTQRMRVSDALTVMQSMTVTSASDSAQEIVFGKVVNSPMPPYTPLTVIQPQEGVKQVACASSRCSLFAVNITQS